MEDYPARYVTSPYEFSATRQGVFFFHGGAGSFPQELVIGSLKTVVPDDDISRRVI